MKIYIDLVLMLNFTFDFLLLLSVALILNRKININKIILASSIGGLSVLFLFIKISSLILFIFKLIISIIMIIISFSYKNIRYTIKNLIFLYISSIILGGFLYFLNITFSYKNNGIIFFNNGLSINFIVLIIISPIIIYIYIKQAKSLRNNYNNYYKIQIYYKSQIITLNSFLDTGNKLVNPYNKSPVIIVNQRYFKNINKITYIPYNTVNNEGLLKCIKVKKIYIEGVGERNNITIGLTNNIKIDDVDCILNMKLLEEK